MSIAVIVCTHGQTSEQMVATAKMIMGKQENLDFLNFLPGENTDDLVLKYEKKMEELDCSKGVLILVDLFGGSPFNAAGMIALKNQNVEVVTGVNIPMLLETLAMRSSSNLDQLVQTAKDSGINGIKIFERSSSEPDDSEEDELE